MVFLAVLGGALLLMGTTVRPPDPSPSKVVWSLDGRHIVFSTPFQGIFVADVAGKRLWSIPRNSPIGDSDNPGNYAPVLSPDGTRVVYVSYDKYDVLDLLYLDSTLDSELETIA